jgi:hypothetical protein
LFSTAPYGGNHYGGSCQIGFSIDQGKTFNTAVSYEGDCPHRNGGEDPSGQEFPFTVPSDLPSGDVVFAWTWMNREQEFFMNCAVVTITGGSGSAPAAAAGSSVPSPAASVKIASIVSRSAATASAVPASNPSSTLDIPDPVVSEVSDATDSTPSAAASSSAGHHCRKRNGRRCHRNSKRDHPLLDATMKYKRTPGAKGQRFVQRAAAVAFSSRPVMLFADVNNGCLSPKTTAELKYPNPGPDVVEGDGEYPLQLPTGTCG